ncbi:hypothetical protein Ocin01_15884 [Orchesella cincta]|uniref:Protein takeout n=1 Tax=Orchesella cincta TaxID=48709 RepID=A0A1D2MCR5_ORCCI|nr:hypothetical protein Ocin01_15884 [Orchesella cincta]
MLETLRNRMGNPCSVAAVLFIVTTSSLLTLTSSTSVAPNKPPAEKENRHLPSFTCSRLQHRVQREIMLHEWGLEKIKFQQRLKKHSQYIVTVEHVRSLHEPLIELRCPGISTPQTIRNSLEFHFHEARFQAEFVRLFDIKSIFPLHSGSMNVKMRLDPLIVQLNHGTDLGLAIRDIYYEPSASNSTSSHENLTNKEHREGGDINSSDGAQSATEAGLVDLEREIESVFVNRIRPDVQNQIKRIVKSVIKRFFETESLVRF